MHCTTNIKGYSLKYDDWGRLVLPLDPLVK